METLVQDARYGLRMLGKSPGLTAILAITLALGIGVNTAIFSVLDGWLLRPLPVRTPEQITVLAAQHKERRNPQFSYPDLLDFEKQAGAAFSDLFAYGLVPSGGLTADGKAGQFAYSAVTANYFSALGVNPALGRVILPGEGERPGGELLVALGHSYWQRRFGGDRGVVGKQVRVDGRAATIVGVAPREFRGTLFAIEMDAYISLSVMSAERDPASFWTDRQDRRLNVFGRLKPGVSLRGAQSVVNVIAERLASEHPATNQGVTVRVIPERFARPAPFVASFVPIIAGLFLALAALVLLLACMNVANILLARATSRLREMAIRTALGAARGRLIRQMLTESLLLALVGGTAGVLLGEWAIDVSGSLLHSVTTRGNYGFRLDTSFDWRVFTYCLAAAIVTGMFVGVWPALRASRVDVNTPLHEGGRSDSGGAGRHGMRGALVVAQVAGSVMLLIVAGLFVRSLSRAEHMYLGFDPDHVLAVMLDTHIIGYDEARTKAFYRQLEERVRAMPGVESASLSFSAPLTYLSKGGNIYIEGHPLAPRQQPPAISYNSIDPAYFETMRVPLLRGRAFKESDSETAWPVAIVNQTMARKFWPNEDPIGKRFSFKSAAGPFLEVVGMARDGQYLFLSPEPQPYFYVPLAQSYSSMGTLEVRSSVPPESLIPKVEEQIRSLAPDSPFLGGSTMRESVHGLAGLFVFRLAASLAAVMGMLGLALAVMGVYGVVSFAASQRTHEIGVRLALGAGRGDILRLVSRQGLALVGAGIAAGLAAAGALTRAMTKLLIGVSPTDPLTYAIVAILLSAVTLLACWLPARRALAVDPMVALRHE